MSSFRLAGSHRRNFTSWLRKETLTSSSFPFQRTKTWSKFQSKFALFNLYTNTNTQPHLQHIHPPPLCSFFSISSFRSRLQKHFLPDWLPFCKKHSLHKATCSSSAFQTQANSSSSASSSSSFAQHSISSSSNSTSSSYLWNSKINSIERFFFTPISWDSMNVTSNSHLESSSSTSSSSSFSPKPIPLFRSILRTSSDLLQVYLALSKARLASLVTLTSMVGYAMAPTSTTLSILFGTTLGTSLCVASANTWNQLMESPYDAQMTRTRHRPLVRHALGPFHTAMFGMTTGIVGVGTLAYCVNPLTAGLGALNILLYAFVYTPMKRFSIVNTWVGAIVGAIPPMMGWTACTGSLWLPEDMGAYLLGFLLYAWQFPHFNALSWNLRSEYAKAGYPMMAVTRPDLNARVAFRYSLALLAFPFLTTYVQLTTPGFVVTSSLVNGLLAYHAFHFWKSKSNTAAKDLFFASLIHLPVILAALMLHKHVQTGSEEDASQGYVSYFKHLYLSVWQSMGSLYFVFTTRDKGESIS